MTLLDQHTVSVTAGLTVLELIEGTVVFDDTRAPWIDATLTVAGTDLGSDLDATQVRRVQISAEQRFSAWAFTYDLTAEYAGLLTSDLTALYGGLLTSDLTALPEMAWNDEPRSATRMELSLLVQSTTELPDGTTRIALASDEAALLEARHADFSGGANYATDIDGDLTLRGTLEQIIDGVYQTNSFGMAGVYQSATTLLPGDFDAPAPRIDFEGGASSAYVFWRTGQTAWEALQPALQLANARIMSRGTEGVQLVSADYVETDSISILEAVNLVDYSTRVDRTLDTYGDAVIINYSEPNDVYSASVALPLSGSWTKAIIVEVDGRCPVNQFTEVEPPEPAEKMLARALRRAYAADVTAISDYNTRPRFGVSLTIPDSPALTGVVQSVTFDLANFEMSITLQEVEALP
jgi:hypothetical protein